MHLQSLVVSAVVVVVVVNDVVVVVRFVYYYGWVGNDYVFLDFLAIVLCYLHITF